MQRKWKFICARSSSDPNLFAQCTCAMMQWLAYCKDTFLYTCWQLTMIVCVAIYRPPPGALGGGWDRLWTCWIWTWLKQWSCHHDNETWCKTFYLQWPIVLIQFHRIQSELAQSWNPLVLHTNIPKTFWENIGRRNTLQLVFWS